MARQDDLDTIVSTLFVLKDEYYYPKNIDVAFVHGRAHGDDSEVLKLVAELVKSGKVRNILMSDTDGRKWGGSIPEEAAPSTATRIKILKKLGIDKKFIKVSTAAYHTKQESEVFLDAAIKNSWQSALVITQPHQILRAMLGTVHAMKKKNCWIEVFASSPSSVCWDVKVFGSQGTKNLPRFKHIIEEYKRIPVYQKKRYIATYKAFQKYIMLRNTKKLYMYGTIQK